MVSVQNTSGQKSTPEPHETAPVELILAPLKGFTDTTFRNVFSIHFGGFDRAISPFVSPWRGGGIKPALVEGLDPQHNTRMPVVPQILTEKTEAFIALARTFSEMGYETVNWNLGCPFPAVIKKGRGSGLLPFPERIDRFLDRVLSIVPNRVSIKTRLGLHSESELIGLLPVLNRYPLAEIIIHPRTGHQRYEGNVDLEAFGRCAQELCAPVVYNGDIRDGAGFRSLAERFPRIRRWMIGRGAISNPFLPSDIRGNTDAGADRLARFCRFHDALFEAYRCRYKGPGHLVDRMKGFWSYFSLAFSDSQTVAKRFQKLRRADDYRETAARFFEQEAVWRS